jgi:hypothetical protein
VGDFNGDGVQDLAVANDNPQSASVLLGNGDGTFQVARNFAAGTYPRSIAVGDFNGDGVQDLAVANLGTYWLFLDGTVSVLLGNGDGSFQPARNLWAGAGPTSVAVGDFNGDGIQDLAVANYGTDPLYLDTGVSVLLGNGDGSFQPARNFGAVRASSFCVAVGDLNGDGVQDLALATYVGVSVLLGNGDGSFQAARNFATGSNPFSVAVGDFNGDGLLDLAVATYYDGVSVLLGNGDGSFQAARNFVAGGGPRFVTMGDFNDDGLLDLAVANSTSHNVSVLLGNGDGSFQPPRNFAAWSGPYSVAVDDFNRDGLEDLAVATGAGVTVLINNTPH